jgi:hypothetical protein
MGKINKIQMGMAPYGGSFSVAYNLLFYSFSAEKYTPDDLCDLLVITLYSSDWHSSSSHLQTCFQGQSVHINGTRLISKNILLTERLLCLLSFKFGVS